MRICEDWRVCGSGFIWGFVCWFVGWCCVLVGGLRGGWSVS